MFKISHLVVCDGEVVLCLNVILLSGLDVKVVVVAVVVVTVAVVVAVVAVVVVVVVSSR